MKVFLQEKCERDSKELIFKPTITRFESKGKLPTNTCHERRKEFEKFEFKPKINRKSKKIILNDLRREQDAATRLF